MNMIIYPETNLTRIARRSRYRHHWTVDLMIALLLFVISVTAQGITLLLILLIGAIIQFVSDGLSGEDLLRLITEFETSSQFTLLGLFLTITLILVPILYCTVFERRPLTSLGFSLNAGFREYVIGLLLGLVMLSSALGICYLSGCVSAMWICSNPMLLLAFFFGYMIQGMSEEVFCRGFLLQTLSICNPPWFALWISSLFSASLHRCNKCIAFRVF
jgi:membrane protease YdiL (CAAX protease family)